MLIRLRRDGMLNVTGFMSDQKPSHGDPALPLMFLNRPTAFITGIGKRAVRTTVISNNNPANRGIGRGNDLGEKLFQFGRGHVAGLGQGALPVYGSESRHGCTDGRTIRHAPEAQNTSAGVSYCP